MRILRFAEQGRAAETNVHIGRAITPGGIGDEQIGPQLPAGRGDGSSRA